MSLTLQAALPRTRKKNFRKQKTRYRVKIDYYKPRELTISGQAQAREANTTLEEITAKIDENKVNVNGLRNWSLRTRPDTVQPGRQRTLSFELTATDDTGTRSYPNTLEVVLNHPNPRNVLPDDYDKGPVNLHLEKAGDHSLENVEYPYHLFRNDIHSRKSKLTLSGTASAKANIEGIAYSFNRGITWRKASGGEKWSFDLSPPQQTSRTYRPWLIGWTEAGIIGDPIKTGKLVYNDVTFKSHIRDLLQGFLQSISRKNTEHLSSLLTSEFQYSNQADPGEFLNHLQSLFGTVDNLNVFHRIRTLDVNKQDVTVVFDLELQGHHRPTSSSFKMVGNEVEIKFSRTNSGQFKITELNGLPNRLFLFNNTNRVATNGSVIRFDKLSIQDRGPGDLQFRKGVVFGDTRWVLNTGETVKDGGI
ncbi:MAG: hypothetical protein ABEK50_13010, partial [bacterium]